MLSFIFKDHVAAAKASAVPSLPPKTALQCRHKMKKLRKRYRAEKQRASRERRRICTGSARVTDHQRLSSSGYVFSTSLPPYLASAAITAIDVLEENPNLITKLKKNITLLCKGLSGVMGVAYIQEVRKASLFFEVG
ncbi:long chain base biosynthesis protein 1-like [Rosa chinensis]|uniref:long chain base biosynthesis protein 1-like n=1 Tax=Rosa chinensis TaxID=74649 RepID=UPI001AD8CD71|nr:long chain base biosynthesis protein 1-like [Rosa chinensis]